MTIEPASYRFDSPRSKPSPPAPEKKKRRRRLWRYMLCTIVGFLAVAAFLFFKDDQLGDHSDLAIIDPPFAEGGAAAFQAWLAAGELADIDVLLDAEAADPDLRDRVGGYLPWDGADVGDVVELNEEALAKAFAADRLGGFSVPIIGRLDDDIEHTGAFINWRVLQTLSAERYEAGDDATAADIASLYLRLADCYTEQCSSLIDFFLGCASQSVAHQCVERLVTVETPEETLLRLERAVASAPDIAGAFERCIRHEFRLGKHLIENIDDYDDGPMVDLEPEERPPPRSLLKKNRTINLFADLYRALIENSKLPVIKRTAPAIGEPPKGLARFSSNAFGNYMSSNMGAVTMMQGVSDVGIAQRRMLLVKVALIRYHKQHGQLPQKLSDLVPDYLGSVPLDRFDGAPLRYDPIKAAIWMIGTDLKDSGGASEPELHSFRSRRPDPTMFVFLRDRKLEAEAEPDPEAEAEP